MDNSNDDHSVKGETQCSFNCETNDDGIVIKYNRTCDGAEVSSGDFSDGTTCQQLEQQAAAEGDTIEPSQSEAPVFDLQEGSI